MSRAYQRPESGQGYYRPDTLPAALRKRAKCVHIAMDEGPAADVASHLNRAADEISRLGSANADLLDACRVMLVKLASEASIGVDEYVAETGIGKFASAAIARAEGRTP